MNAITRADSLPLIALPLPGLRMMLIIIALLITAFGIIYIKDVNRRLFIDYQELQQTSAVLQTDYEKLLLEKSAWSRQDRIQAEAEQRLNMQVPVGDSIIMVKLKNAE